MSVPTESRRGTRASFAPLSDAPDPSIKDDARPLVLLALMHDYAARDFVDSKVLEELAQHVRLAFISSDRLTIDLTSYGPIVARHEMGTWRLRLWWLAAGLWHIHRRRRFELSHRNVLRQATFGVSARAERLVDILSRVGLALPLALILRGLLRAIAPCVVPKNLDPSAIVVYTGVRSFFADDIVRDARRRHIPLLALVNNWDNLNTASFLEEPPYLGVWGEQGFLIARLMHGLPAHRIFVIGAPRFEIYRKNVPTRDEARARLGLSPDRRVLLFCGSGCSFEEVSLLEELDAAIEAGRLPADLIVLYKPHPYRFKRVSERSFDASRFRHVSQVPQGRRKLTELERYPDLLVSADALISPFSSMVIEGAAFSLPALCLGYNDPGHANHDWGRAAFNLHNYPMRHGEWAVTCERRTDFLDCCRQLVALIGDPVAAGGAVAAAEMVWRKGHVSVAKRLAEAVERVTAGDHADESLSRAVASIVPLVDRAADRALLEKD